MPRLARRAPHRLLATVGRFDDGPPDQHGKPSSAGRPLASTKDVIEHAIRVAQEVIDQQIGSGERILRFLRNAPVSKRRESPLDAKSGASLTERTVELINEFGVLVVEFLETLAHSRTVIEVVSRWLAPGAPCSPPAGLPAGAAAGAAPGGRAEVFVSSRQPAKVEARFLAAPPEVARVPGLHRTGAAPIDGIAYLQESHAFCVTIPDDQPAGVYHGVIVGRHDEEVLGTMVATVAMA